MKKIGIITFHNSSNYGAALQAYATHKFLKDLNYDARFIDFENVYEKKGKKIVTYRKHISVKQNVIHFLKATIFRATFYSKKSFTKFNKLLPKTKTYIYYNELESMKDIFDVLLTGSDQVWNPAITGGDLEPAFFSTFAPTTKKISYASSMGSHQIQETEKKQYKLYLEKFSHISVREIFAKQQLASISIPHVEVTMDPTFLIDRSSWISFGNQGDLSKYTYLKPHSYIFVYLMTAYDESADFLVMMKEKLNLPIVFIGFSTLKRRGVDHLILGATPQEFIYLLEKAAYVITSSFHGAAFAIQLNKQFLCLQNKSNAMRLTNLLEKLSLQNRLVTDFFSVEAPPLIDYTKVNQVLEDLKIKSREWLIHAIEE